MTAAASLTAPFIVAVTAVVLRRTAGPVASWLFLFGLVFYIGRFGLAQPVFWNRPAFLASMSEDFGAMIALIIAALLIAEWSGTQRSWSVRCFAVAAVLIGVQWGLVRLPLPDIFVKVALIAICLWFLSQAYRGIRYIIRRKSRIISPSADLDLV